MDTSWSLRDSYMGILLNNWTDKDGKTTKSPRNRSVKGPMRRKSGREGGPEVIK